MPAPRDTQYAKGNKGGKGGPSKFQPEYIEIATRLCVRGLTDGDIAEVLGVSERTIHSWKLQHEEFAAALKRSKEQAKPSWRRRSSSELMASSMKSRRQRHRVRR
jgi:uncharacterized protein YjcR